MTTETANERGSRRQLQGTVSSAKMQKTVVVTVTRFIKHGEYSKYVRSSKSYMAHDEGGSCRPGDVVTIAETRPLSKHKRWRVVSVDRKAVE